MNTPAIRASASLVSHVKVNEIRIETAMVTDRPGIAPMYTPAKDPTAVSSRSDGSSQAIRK